MNDTKKTPKLVGHENLDYEETPLPQPLPKREPPNDVEFDFICHGCQGRTLQELVRGYDGERVRRALWCHACGATRIDVQGRHSPDSWSVDQQSKPVLDREDITAEPRITVTSLTEADAAFRDKMNKMVCDLRAQGYTVEQIAEAAGLTVKDFFFPSAPGETMKMCSHCGRPMAYAKEGDGDRPLTKPELDAMHQATDEVKARDGDCKHERNERLGGLAPRRKCLDCGQQLRLNMDERRWYAEDGTPGPMMRPPGGEPHKGADDDEKPTVTHLMVVGTDVAICGEVPERAKKISEGKKVKKGDEVEDDMCPACLKNGIALGIIEDDEEVGRG